MKDRREEVFGFVFFQNVFLTDVAQRAATSCSGAEIGLKKKFVKKKKKNLKHLLLLLKDHCKDNLEAEENVVLDGGVGGVGWGLNGGWAARFR